MRALVTGGAGFIGSNLVDALLERGDEVCVLDDITTGRRENLTGALARGAELVEASVADAPTVLALLERVRPEAVFHLAAQIDVRRSMEDPAFDAGVNVVGTINMLEAAAHTGVRRFVLSSTGGAIYGEGRVMPASEDHPIAPESAYGQSKFCAEGYCGLYQRMHGLGAIPLRYSNVYGPRQDPLGEAGVCAIFCARALAGEPATVFGDGLQTRDFVYVGDVVAANLAAVESSAGEPVNIGCGVQTSVLDLAEELGRLTGRPFVPEHAPARAGEVRHIALDATRAGELLGWKSQVALSEGLKRTLEWLRG